jgi:endonuclease-3
MKKKSGKKLQQIHDLLYQLYGECTCPLKHENPFQLLAAVMLSAQCRDDRVNQVTEKLFALAPDAAEMAALPVEKIEEIIQPCGLHKAKSRNLHSAAAMIVEKFSGQIPQSMDELTTLPGIGRKSANVILGNAFGIPGFPVDTHVRRVLNRLGTVHTQDPEKIEAEVNAQIAPEYWTNFSHLLITLGRKVCSARSPRCQECVLKNLCTAKKVEVKE